jgi:hypothetical protein
VKIFDMLRKIFWVSEWFGDCLCVFWSILLGVLCVFVMYGRFLEIFDMLEGYLCVLREIFENFDMLWRIFENFLSVGDVCDVFFCVFVICGKFVEIFDMLWNFFYGF